MYFKSAGETCVLRRIIYIRSFETGKTFCFGAPLRQKLKKQKLKWKTVLKKIRYYTGKNLISCNMSQIQSKRNKPNIPDRRSASNWIIPFHCRALRTRCCIAIFHLGQIALRTRLSRPRDGAASAAKWKKYSFFHGLKCINFDIAIFHLKHNHRKNSVVTVEEHEEHISHAPVTALHRLESGKIFPKWKQLISQKLMYHVSWENAGWLWNSLPRENAIYYCQSKRTAKVEA